MGGSGSGSIAGSFSPGFAAPESGPSASGSGRSRAGAFSGTSSSTSAVGTVSGATRGTSARGSSRFGGASTNAGSSAAKDPDTWDRWWDRNEDEFLWTAGLESSSHVVSGVGGLPMGRRGSSTARQGLSRSAIYTQIVPDLLELVTSGDDTRVVNAALMALGRAVDPPFHDPLLEALPTLLARGDLPVQMAATMALGLSSSSDGTETLINLMSCSGEGHQLVHASFVPAQVRAAAALALGFGNDPAAIPALMDIIERSPASENETRTSAVMALGLMDNNAAGRAASWLARRLADRKLDPAVKSAIPVALARLDRPGAQEALLEVLDDRDTDRWVRQSAAIGLGRLASMDDDEALTALTRLVEKQKDGPTRRFALLSLARIGAADSEASGHREAHDELLDLFSQSVSRPDHKLDRPWAALAAGLYVRGQTGARGVLQDRVKTEYDDIHDTDIKGAFALSLGLMGAEDVVDTLRSDYVTVMNDRFRRHVAVSLGMLGAGKDSRDLLRGELVREGAGSGLRRAVGAALGMLGDEFAPQVAATSFGETPSLQTRTSLAVSMGVMRHVSNVGTLQLATLDDELDNETRASAALGLGRLVETTAMPWYARLSIDSNVSAPRSTLAALLPAR